MSLSPQFKKGLFAERLKQERLKLRLTQQELAQMCKLGANQISRYESDDREPSFQALFRIASVLNVSTDYLVGLTDNPTEVAIFSDLGPHEREILASFHKDGWAGIIHLGAEHLAK